jgi:hypothetical protein
MDGSDDGVGMSADVRDPESDDDACWKERDVLVTKEEEILAADGEDAVAELSGEEEGTAILDAVLDVPGWAARETAR